MAERVNATPCPIRSVRRPPYPRLRLHLRGVLRTTRRGRYHGDHHVRFLAGRPPGERRCRLRGAQQLGRPSGRQGERSHRGAGRGGPGGRRRRAAGVRRDPGARAVRRPGPRGPAAGRAHRGDRPADHRGERQADQVGPRRGRPCRLGVPLGRRGGPPDQRRDHAAGHRPGRRGPFRAGAPLPARRGAGHRPVQLPAEPGRPQGRPGDRGRCADHPQAGPGDPAVGHGAGRDPGRDRPADRFLERSAGPERPDAGPGAGPAAAGDLLHRFGQGRLPDHGLGAAQAHHPGAGRQRRGRGARRLVLRGGPGLGGHPDRDVRQLPGRPVLHLGAARDRRRLGLRRAGGEGRRQGGRAGHR